MAETNGIAKEIRAALEREPRVHLHQSTITISTPGDKIVLEGEVPDITGKRLIVECARRVSPKQEVIDRVSVKPTEQLGDGAIRDFVCRHLLEEPVFLRTTIACRIAGDDRVIVREPDDADSRIQAAIANGVVTLSGEVLSVSHRRMAEVLAWWARGCRNVVNELNVQPPERDNDAEINDAIDLVLDKDPIVHSDQVIVGVYDGCVKIRGLVATAEEKRMVEQDVWYVGGVRDVINEIKIYRTPTGREPLPASSPEFD